jgi:hypothetical protein
MSEPERAPGGRRPEEKARAIVRIVLGVAQVMAATVTLVLLLAFGTAWPTLAAAGVAGLLVLTSKLLFRGPGS